MTYIPEQGIFAYEFGLSKEVARRVVDEIIKLSSQIADGELLDESGLSSEDELALLLAKIKAYAEKNGIGTLKFTEDNNGVIQHIILVSDGNETVCTGHFGDMWENGDLFGVAETPNLTLKLLAKFP